LVGRSVGHGTSHLVTFGFSVTIITLGQRTSHMACILTFDHAWSHFVTYGHA